DHARNRETCRRRKESRHAAAYAAARWSAARRCCGLVSAEPASARSWRSASRTSSGRSRTSRIRAAWGPSRASTRNRSGPSTAGAWATAARSEIGKHTSELQSRGHLVCRLLLEKKKKNKKRTPIIYKTKRPTTLTAHTDN